MGDFFNLEDYFGYEKVTSKATTISMIFYAPIKQHVNSTLPLDSIMACLHDDLAMVSSPISLPLEPLESFPPTSHFSMHSKDDIAWMVDTRASQKILGWTLGLHNT